MNFTTFKKRLTKIQQLDSQLDEMIDKKLNSDPFIEDGGGVRSPFLSDLIIEHLITLFYGVINNQKFSYNNMKNFVEYYLLDNNYGGEATFGSKRYLLDDYVELYNYVQIMGEK